MSNTIDSLNIQIQAQATRANNALDKLVSKLTVLESSLASLNAQPLNTLSSGIDNLSNAMTRFNASGVKTQDFTRLASNLSKLALVNYGAIESGARGILNLSSALGNLSNIATVSQEISNVIIALGKFGGASVSRAIANIPLLTNQLMSMFQTLATAPRISNNVIQMVNALANLSSMGSKVGTATRSMSNNLRMYNSVAGSSRRHTLSLAAAFGKFYASYFLVVRGIKLLWKSVQSSMNYVETFNYFNVTMDKIAKEFQGQYEKFGYDSAEAYAESFQSRINDLTTKMTGFTVGEYGELTEANTKNLGLDPNQLMNFQAKLASITNSVGLVGEASTATSKALSMLSADLSSLTNVDLSDVMTNLSSGLIGQSRALYKYGIDITNATLSEYALANGIAKAVSSMTQSEKMQLRLLAILDQSKIAWGDQANTVNSVANQYRIFKQQAANLGRTLGNLLLPIIQNILPWLNGLMIALRKLLTLLGFQAWGVDWLQDLLDGISGGASATDDLEDSLEDLDDTLGSANKNAKKLKATILSFDELNIMNGQDDSSGSSGAISSGIDLTSEINSALDDYEKVWNEAFANMQNKAEAFADSIGKALEPLKKLLSDMLDGNWFEAGKDTSDLISGIFDWFSSAIDNVNWDQIGRNIGDYLRGIKWNQIFNSVGRLIYNVLKATIELWLGSFSKDPVGTLTITFGAILFKILGAKLTLAYITKSLAVAIFGDGFIKGLTVTLPQLILTFAQINPGMVGELWVKIDDWLHREILPDNWKQFEKDFNDALWRVFTNTFSWKNTKEVWKFAQDALNDIVKAFEEQDWGRIGKDIILGIVGVLTTPFTFIIDPILSFFQSVYDEICNAFGIHSPAREMIPIGENIMLGIVNGFKEKIQSFLNAIIEFKNKVIPKFDKSQWTFNGVSEGFDKTFSEAKDNVSSWWATFSGETIPKIKSLFDQDNWTFDSIRTGLVNSFTSAIESVKQVWNAFADALNSHLSFTIDPIKILGKTVFDGAKIDLGKIPKFFNGGFAEDGLFMANHGELVGGFANGKTAVANNDQIIDGIKNGVIEAMMQVRMSSQTNNNQGKVVIPIYMNGKEVGRGAADSIGQLIQNGEIQPYWI